MLTTLLTPNLYSKLLKCICAPEKWDGLRIPVKVRGYVNILTKFILLSAYYLSYMVARKEQNRGKTREVYSIIATTLTTTKRRVTRPYFADISFKQILRKKH